MSNLSQSIQQWMSLKGMSQAELAAAAKTTRATISHIVSGKTTKTTLLPNIAAALGVTVEQLTKGPGMKHSGLMPVAPWDSKTPLDSDGVELPLFREVALSAGAGMTEVLENHGAKLRFARSTLSRNGIIPSNAACCFVSGDSMEPILPDGSTVAIDTGNKLIVDGKMYAIDQGGMMRVKYLYRLPGGGIRIRSANRDEYQDEEIFPENEQEFRILGRVFWYGVLLT